jgi:Holliday junction DNA helicase RuvA
MIATLRGQVTEKTLDSVVLEVQGVGYGLLVTKDDYEKFVTGETAKVYVYENIKEDAYDQEAI